VRPSGSDVAAVQAGSRLLCYEFIPRASMVQWQSANAGPKFIVKDVLQQALIHYFVVCDRECRRMHQLCWTAPAP